MKVLRLGLLFIFLLFTGEAHATIAKRDEITHYIIKGLGKPSENESKEKKEARQLAILLSKSPMGRLSPQVPWRHLQNLLEALFIAQLFGWCCNGCPCCGLSAPVRCVIIVIILIIIIVIIVVPVLTGELISKEEQHDFRLKQQFQKATEKSRFCQREEVS